MQGFHRIDAKSYHADFAPAPSLSASIAKVIYNECAESAWYQHPRLNPTHQQWDGSSSMDIGTAAHACLLEGSEAGIVVVDANDWRTNAAKEQRDAANANGKVAILAHKMNQVRAMVSAARNKIGKSEIAGILDDGEPELSALWEQGGVWNRMRLDLLSRRMGIVLDYKTTDGSADPARWIDRQIDNMGYDIQAAHYLDGMEILTGENFKWLWLVQEQNPPYLCSIIGCGNATLELGHKKVNYSRRIFAECLESGIWPGYPNQICWSEPQPWQIMAAENRDLMQGQGGE